MGDALITAAIVLWNGVARPTTFVSSSQLQAAIPASDLVSSAEITTATVSVLNLDGGTSNPQLFTIVGPSVGVVQSAIAGSAQSVSVSTPNITTPLTQPGQAAVSATVNNAGAPDPIAVTA